MTNDRLALEHDIATRLHPVARAWQRLADRMLAEHGISNSAAWALIHIDRLGAAAHQADLARAIGVAEASLVRTLHQLEQGGLVERRRDAGDGRAKHLVLTAAGRALADRIDARLVGLRAELVAGVADGELAAAAALLDLLAGRLATRLGGRA